MLTLPVQDTDRAKQYSVYGMQICSDFRLPLTEVKPAPASAPD
jgi:hypothetical protein